METHNLSKSIRIFLFIVALSSFSAASAKIMEVTGSNDFSSPKFSSALLTPSDTSQPPTYRIAVQVEQTTDNFWYYYQFNNTIWNSYTHSVLYLSLYRYSSQFHKMVPYLAADFPSSIVYEAPYWVSNVPLKQGVRWSDGREVTADDFVFMVEAYQTLGLGSQWASLGPPLHHAEALSDYFLKIYFTSNPGVTRWPFSIGTEPILARHYWQPILNQAVLQPDPLGWFTAYEPVGEPTNGPFTRKEWVPGSYVEHFANPFYYFKGLEVTEYEDGSYREVLPGKYTFSAYGSASGNILIHYVEGPYVSNLRFITSGSANNGALMLLNDMADFMLRTGSINSTNWTSLNNDPNITRIDNPPNGFRYLTFNNRRSPLGLVAFHQAVASLIDKEYIANALYGGSIDPLYTFVFPHNTFWYKPTVHIGEGLTREQRINQAVGILTFAGFSWTVPPQWDPVSQTVVPGSGFKYNSQPVPALELIAPDYPYDPIRATTATYIAIWLNEAGITTNVSLLDWDILVNRMFVQQDFDMAILGWSLSYSPDYLCDFFASWQGNLNGNNAGGYSNPTFDANCTGFYSATDWETARQYMYDNQDILANDLPYVLLFTNDVVEFYRNDRVAYPFTSMLNGLGSQSGMPSLVKIVPAVQVIGAAGGQVDAPGANLTFPVEAFDQSVNITYELSSMVVDLPNPGIFFDLQATNVSDGQPATLQPGMTYTVVVAYEEAALPPGISEDSLKLYYWDDMNDQWVVEPTSLVNTLQDTITATPNHFSLWGIIGEYQIFLPITIR